MQHNRHCCHSNTGKHSIIAKANFHDITTLSDNDLKNCAELETN